MFLALAFVVCFAGGFVPVINADAYVLAAAVLAPRTGAIALIAVAAAGQVAGKLVMILTLRHAGGVMATRCLAAVPGRLLPSAVLVLAPRVIVGGLS